MKEKVSSSQKALNVWAIILIMWSIYRANFGVSLPSWMDEFIVKPFFFVLPIWWYTRNIEKKDFLKRVNFHLKTFWVDMGLGLLFGGVFILAALISSVLKSGSIPFSVNHIFKLSTLFLFITALATSLSEELLSRGFVLTHLFEESKNMVSAIFISSILFFFLHIPILFTADHITGTILLQVMTMDIAFSMIISYLYLKRKSLFLPIIIHAFYIVSLSLFI